MTIRGGGIPRGPAPELHLRTRARVARKLAKAHAGGEVFLHALDRGWRRGFEKLRPKLQPVGPVVLPATARRHPFAGRNRRGVADGGHKVLMAAGFYPQNAEAVLLVVEGYPFHKPGQNLARFVILRHDFAGQLSGRTIRRVGPS